MYIIIIVLSFIAEISILFSDSVNLKSILDAIQDTEHVQTIITLDKVSDEDILGRANKLGIRILDFMELLVRV